VILIDERQGSRELSHIIPNSTLVHLDYGDAMFIGQGPEGPVSIGVERKTIHDLIASIDTGRLSGHQLPGLMDDYYRVYLVVEGMWKEGQTGEVLVRRGREWRMLTHGQRHYSVAGVWHYLCTLEEMTGVRVRVSPTIRTTARIIEHLAGWWGKEWDKHHAHMAMHKPPPPTAFLTPPSFLMRIAAELPGVGWTRAKAVDVHFTGSPRRMWEADVKEWQKVEGVGKVVAKAVWGELHK
jgi:ERCC4-type nuclease